MKIQIAIKKLINEMCSKGMFSNDLCIYMNRETHDDLLAELLIFSDKENIFIQQYSGLNVAIYDGIIDNTVIIGTSTNINKEGEK